MRPTHAKVQNRQKTDSNATNRSKIDANAVNWARMDSSAMNRSKIEPNALNTSLSAYAMAAKQPKNSPLSSKVSDPRNPFDAAKQKAAADTISETKRMLSNGKSQCQHDFPIIFLVCRGPAGRLKCVVRTGEPSFIFPSRLQTLTARSTRFQLIYIIERFKMCALCSREKEGELNNSINAC